MEIRSLNMLRGIAALIVLVSHFSGATGWLGEYPASGAGQLGVMLFFILSGFLMAYLYLDRALDFAQLCRYVVARFARVVPLFAAVVGLSAVLPRLGVTGVLYDLPTRAPVLSHVLLLSGKSILWTIPTELHFYAVFVVVWFVFGRQRTIGLLLVGLAVVFGFIEVSRVKGSIGSVPYEFRLPQVIRDRVRRSPGRSSSGEPRGRLSRKDLVLALSTARSGDACSSQARPTRRARILGVRRQLSRARYCSVSRL